MLQMSLTVQMSPMFAPKYYEAHVTIEPVFGKRFHEFEILCHAQGFKPAELLLQKSREETPFRSTKDSFATGHDKDADLLYGRMMQLLVELQVADFKVWRAKIECVIYDLRFDRLLKIKEVANEE